MTGSWFGEWGGAGCWSYSGMASRLFTLRTANTVPNTANQETGTPPPHLVPRA